MALLGARAFAAYRSGMGRLPSGAAKNPHVTVATSAFPTAARGCAGL
jgi:hypothetical protein